MTREQLIENFADSVEQERIALGYFSGTDGAGTWYVPLNLQTNHKRRDL